MGTFACRPPVAHHGYSQSPDPGCSVAHPRNRPHLQPVTNRPGNTLLTGSASLLLSATPPHQRRLSFSPSPSATQVRTSRAVRSTNVSRDRRVPSSPARRAVTAVTRIDSPSVV